MPHCITSICSSITQKKLVYFHEYKLPQTCLSCSYTEIIYYHRFRTKLKVDENTYYSSNTHSLIIQEWSTETHLNSFLVSLAFPNVRASIVLAAKHDNHILIKLKAFTIKITYPVYKNMLGNHYSYSFSQIHKYRKIGKLTNFSNSRLLD